MLKGALNCFKLNFVFQSQKNFFHVFSATKDSFTLGLSVVWFMNLSVVDPNPPIMAG